MDSLFDKDSKLQTADGKELVGYLTTELFNKAKRYREPTDFNWLNYNAYFENNTWYVINRRTGAMSQVPVAEWRDKISIPETFIAHRAIKSLILNKDPTYTVMPTRNDEEYDYSKGAMFPGTQQTVGSYVDGPIMRAAKIASNYLEIFEDEEDLKLKRDELVDDGLRMGNGYWKLGYDQSKKDGLGDVVVRRISPFSLLIDPQCTNPKTWENCRYIVFSAPMDVDYIAARYGVRVEPDNKVSASPFEERMLMDNAGGSEKPQGMRVVHEFEIKEPLYVTIDENGNRITTSIIRVVTCTDEEILEDRYDPLEINRFSVLALQYNAKPGQIYADGNIRHQMQIKEQLDKRLSHLVDNTKRMSLPRLIVAKGTINEDDVNDEPGSWIEVDDTISKFTPQILQGAPMSQDVSYIIDYHERKLQDVVGLHDVSRGILPAGITSGRQLELAQAADTQVLGPYIKELERFMAEAAKMILMIMQKKYTSERVFSYMDKEEGQMNATFDPATLDFSRVRVEISSYLANTKAARQDILMQLFQAGAIGPETVARGFEFPDLRRVLDDQRQWAQQQQSRQAQPPQGMPQGAPVSAGAGLTAPQETPSFR